MSDPITITAVSIIGFVFSKVAETVTVKATEALLSKINKLRQKIVDKLSISYNAKPEIDKLEQGVEPDLELLADYLKVAMREDKEFASEIQQLAEEIDKDFENAGEGQNVMNVYGGKAYMQNQNKGTIYNADSIIFGNLPK